DSTLRPSTCSPFTQSRPLGHLLRERTLRAIGIVLHAKVFVDLEQPLLVRDSAQKFFPARITSKKTRGSGFESSVRYLRGQLCVFCPKLCARWGGSLELVRRPEWKQHICEDVRGTRFTDQRHLLW